MVPRFEKRVRAFAADISGLVIVFILAAFGLADFDSSIRAIIQVTALILTFFFLIIFPHLIKSKQTFGKRIQKIKVVNLDGTEATKFKLILRELFKYSASTLTFGLYLVIAYFALTEKQVSRTIHDYIFKTKVIDLDTSPKNRQYTDAIRTDTMKNTRLE
ncbi:RDD family protein [Acholeplasma granularum]|uniref:RDD family protein n=1 Tax=Acholeplasma granularum TaxID=264635 RepID=UPI00046EC497|nr:RDD family protein [Acholeplasma granularum]